MSGHEYFTEGVGNSTEKMLKHQYTVVHEMIFFHFLKMKYENLHEVKDQLQLCPFVFENANYYLLFSLK